LSKPYFSVDYGQVIGKMSDFTWPNIHGLKLDPKESHVWGTQEEVLVTPLKLAVPTIVCFNMAKPMISHPRNHHKRVVDTIPKS